MSKVNFLNVPIDALTVDQTINLIDSAVQEGRQLHHVVINVGKFVEMGRNRQLREAVLNADIINAEGKGILWASRILKQPLPESVNGIDLMQALVKQARQRRYRIFLFGAKEDVVSDVARLYAEKYSPDIIVGYRNGFFDPSEESGIAQRIADSGANMLFVGISSPTKEEFLARNKGTLRTVSLLMGVGGSFEVVAGRVQRAPLWVQSAGLEMFYRFLQEPRRLWRRFLYGHSKFVQMVLVEMLRQVFR